MTFSKDYTIQSTKVDPDNNIVRLVQFAMTVTSPDYPGVSTGHAGLIDIGFANLTPQSPLADFVAAIETFLQPQNEMLEFHFNNNLQMAYLEATLTNVKPDVAPEDPVVYFDLMPVDFELGMLRLNITFEQIDAVIEAMAEPDRTIARIYWRRATRFARDNWLVDEIGAAFNKTPEEINQAWLDTQITIANQAEYLASGE